MMSEVSFREFFRAASLSAILAGVFLAAGIILAIASRISLDSSGHDLVAQIDALPKTMNEPSCLCQDCPHYGFAILCQFSAIVAG